MNKPLAVPAADREVKASDNQPDPFGAVQIHIEDLLTEARNFADGDPVSTEGQAETVSRLIDDLRKAEKAADDVRKAEVAPLDEQRDAIQARYNVYIAPLKNKTPGKVALALEALKKALAPWLAAIEAENERKAAEARAEAARAAEEAATAMRAAQASTDLSAREAAEELVTQARQAGRTATQAAGAKAHAGGGERNMGLRDNFQPKLTDGFEALKYYWGRRRPELEAFALTLAQADVRAGVRTIPGFEITNERRL